jgi:hypothetical protein
MPDGELIPRTPRKKSDANDDAAALASGEMDGAKQ